MIQPGQASVKTKLLNQASMTAESRWRVSCISTGENNCLGKMSVKRGEMMKKRLVWWGGKNTETQTSQLCDRLVAECVTALSDSRTIQ